VCPGITTSIALYTDLLIDNGDSTEATDGAGSKCGGGDGPDVVYAVTAKGKGYLTATLEEDAPFDGIVHVRTTCKDPLSELGCGQDSVTVPVEKDELVYVYVDGPLPAPGSPLMSSGTFKLLLHLSGCGNGTLETANEECDDGNTLFLDGCSSECAVECDCPDEVGACTVFEDPTTHHCYALVKDSDQGWDGGVAACAGWGGTLAVLATQAEIDSVKPALSSGSNEIWIGGSDKAVEGTFVWVNAEPWSYPGQNPPWFDNFVGMDEPNGDDGENCVEIYKSDGRLNDEQCDQSHDYLCERPPAGEVLPNSQ